MIRPKSSRSLQRTTFVNLERLVLEKIAQVIPSLEVWKFSVKAIETRSTSALVHIPCRSIRSPVPRWYLLSRSHPPRPAARSPMTSVKKVMYENISPKSDATDHQSHN